MENRNENPQKFEALVVCIEFLLVLAIYLFVAHLDYLQAQ